jgi:F-type H+-transporting ATPase subunit b
VISVDWTLGLQFLNFVIILLVLNKILYKPLQKIMAERRQNIDGSHAKAKELEASIEEKMKLYQQQLNDAKAQANEERNQLRKVATTEESKILEQANKKATTQLNAIKAQVTVEAGKASQALRSEAESLAGQIATKILGRELA